MPKSKQPLAEVSWPLKRLFMAEVDNEAEGGTSPATLGTAADSLRQGYEPYVGFDADAAAVELAALLDAHGGDALLEDFLTDEDWEGHSRCNMHCPGPAT